ncbi:STAS domain-containing protein [Streptomyces sp. NPDC059957]|uniref:STAS domain-containing protein n=1 Tax=Streptomyces sp. NPDC059957 TaxID=3347016 RepID=UPI003652D54A
MSAEVVLDLTQLTFCESSSLNAILQARPTAEEHGRRISLHAPTQHVQQGGGGSLLLPSPPWSARCPRACYRRCGPS